MPCSVHHCTARARKARVGAGRAYHVPAVGHDARDVVAVRGEVVLPTQHVIVHASPRGPARPPPTVLAAPGVADLLDLTRPVALLVVAVLHFVPDDNLAAVLADYRHALAPGSVQVISHGSDDQDDPDVAAAMRALREGYRGSANEVTLRSRAQLLDLLAGTDLVAPGLVDLAAWPTPDPGEPPTGGYAAIGRLPTAGARHHDP